MLASERSEGKEIIWKGEKLITKKATKQEFLNLDLVLASAGGSISKKWLSTIMEQNALLIDNSSAFRLDNNVPLIVPEVNASDVFNHDGVIANPNCTTILLALVLAVSYTHLTLPTNREV